MFVARLSLVILSGKGINPAWFLHLNSKEGMVLFVSLKDILFMEALCTYIHIGLFDDSFSLKDLGMS